MAGENGGNEDTRKWRERERAGHLRGRNMAGEKRREQNGARTMAREICREKYVGRNMSGEEGREREKNSDQELHALIGFNIK